MCRLYAIIIPLYIKDLFEYLRKLLSDGGPGTNPSQIPRKDYIKKNLQQTSNIKYIHYIINLLTNKPCHSFLFLDPRLLFLQLYDIIPV